LTPRAKAPQKPSATSVVSPSVLTDLTSAQIPSWDRYDLARRFRGAPAAPPVSATPPSDEIGSLATFWVSNGDTNSYLQVKAELVYTTEHVAMWVEEGVSYDRNVLVAAADRFEAKTYPTDRRYFGDEPSPGIDDDVRLYILNTTQLGSGVLGYFYSPSEYLASVVPYSNEHEIFFISTAALSMGEDAYGGVLAHEFQHMIGWNTDMNEESWVSEGLSELAIFVNDLGSSDFVPSFLQNPDLQLNTWPENGNTGPHYGASYLFMAYLLDRFGEEAIRALEADPANGLVGIDDTLKRIDPSMDADRLFGEWSLANLLQNPDVSPGVYAYTNAPGLFSPGVAEAFEQYPVPLTTFQVHQYGTDYISLRGPAHLQISFSGATQARIIPADTVNTDGDPSTDDSFVWWSNRGDASDMTLTHYIDLAQVSQAQLDFDVWYLLEVSADHGQTWTILRGSYATDSNPQGNAYGPGYTGSSTDQPDANAEGWLHETIDLSPYAGKEVLLRFETITDDAVNQPGMAIDNICVSAVNFCDDVEQGPGDWEAQGFVRHNNALPQSYLVQVVVPGDDGSVTVLPFSLDAANQGTITITVGGQKPAMLVISGLTRYTTETADYQIEIEALSP
jgi:immune inhibitor A